MIKKTARFIASPLLIAGRVIGKDVQGARSRLQSLLAGYSNTTSETAHVDFMTACEEVKRRDNMTEEQLRIHLASLMDRLRRRSRLMYSAFLFGAIYASFLAWTGVVIGSLVVMLWSLIMCIVAARCAMKVRQIQTRTLFSFMQFVDDGKFFV